MLINREVATSPSVLQLWLLLSMIRAISLQTSITKVINPHQVDLVSKFIGLKYVFDVIIGFKKVF